MKLKLELPRSTSVSSDAGAINAPLARVEANLSEKSEAYLCFFERTYAFQILIPGTLFCMEGTDRQIRTESSLSVDH